jgi:TonB family protein
MSTRSKYSVDYGYNLSVNRAPEELPMKLRIALLLCISVTAVAAQPQPQASAAAQPDTAKLAQIRHLLDLMGLTNRPPELWQSMMKQMQDSSVTNMFSPGGTSADSPEAKRYSTLLQEHMLAKMKAFDLAAIYVPIFDKSYSSEDLNGLIAFYESPVGKKMVRVQFALYSEAIKSFGPAISNMIKDSEAEIKKEHPELDADKPTELTPNAETQANHPVQRIRKGGDVAMASVIHSVQPVYPELARRRGIQGTVLVHTIIDKDGSVIEAKYISGPPELTKAAIDAVSQWRFRPTLLEGIPVQVECIFELNFNLGK